VPVVTTQEPEPRVARWPDVMDPATAGRYLNLPEASVRALLRSGKLPGARLGRLWRVSRAALDAMLLTRTAPPAERPPLAPEPEWTPAAPMLRRRGRPPTPGRAARSATT
jgi:excisionase family DNA binding protein